MKRDVHFEVKEKERTCHLNDDGVREAEKVAGVESFYTPGNMEWPHLIDNALKAHHLYKRDRDYVVQPDGEVVIVDEFTGRLMIGRQWSDGLHQAVEAKEKVKVKEENQTLATITLQNFFKLYKKLAGMTGTAMTEATEFYKVYELDVIAIPTNQALVRVNHADVIFRYEREKLDAILDEIREVNSSGRPILVGTTSIEKSEELARMLKRYGIPHQVLNAKYHEREAEIVAQAGRRGAVTIATNMAGRGTDIILGGNPEFMAWADLKRLTDEDGRPLYQTRLDVSRETWLEAVNRYEPEMKVEGREVAAVGGLHIIGTERHESRRIDNQLRGRAGRQGDPGSSRFFLSLEDDLMRKFAGEWVSAVLTRLGMQEGEAIESKMVSRRIEGAQKKVEERNFDIRKNLLEYDEVMDEQRKRVYSFRQSLLEGAPPKEMILEMVDKQIEDAARRVLADDYGAATFAESVGHALGVELTARDIKGASFEDAQEIARSKAERQLADTVRQAIEENLPPDADRSEWTWQALANWANTRFGLNVKEKDLKKIAAIEQDDELPASNDNLEEFLNEKAAESIQKIDLSKASEFLQSDWGRRTLADWVHHKFTMVIDPASWADIDRARDRSSHPGPGSRALRPEGSRAAVTDRTQAISRAIDRSRRPPDTTGTAWQPGRVIAIKPRSIPTSYARSCVLRSRQGSSNWPSRATPARNCRASSTQSLRPPASRFRTGETDAHRTTSRPHSKSWLPGPITHSAFRITSSALESMTHREIRDTLLNALDARHRPEMRDMEKSVLLQILDSSWMEHLRTMDHLRSSIGLQGYAQIDPKVEYKREGMRIFGEMWNGIGDRVTDLIFRVEQFDPEILDDLGSRWQLDRAQTIHQQAESQLTSRTDLRWRAPPARCGNRRQRTLHREETRAGAKRWKKGRSQ